MRYLFQVLSAILFCFYSVAAMAQQPMTVGDLLGRGGSLIPKDELLSLMSGATMEGEQHRTGAKFKNLMKADGSFAGEAVQRGGNQIRTFGTWQVMNNGSVRTQVGNNTQPGYRQNDLYYYKLGDKYFASQSPEKEGELMERMFLR